MPVCTECGTTFVRREHLTRHRAAIHDRTSSFTCEHCHRVFTRSDSFRRHCRAHGVVRPFRKRATAPAGTQRACQACLAARVKCSGGIPCFHCITRGVPCLLNAVNAPDYQRGATSTTPDEHPPIAGEASRNADTTALPSPLPESPTSSPLLPEPRLTHAQNQQSHGSSFAREDTTLMGYAGPTSVLTFAAPVGINVPPTVLETVGDLLYDTFDSLSNGRNWLPPQNPAVLNSIPADNAIPRQTIGLHDGMTRDDASPVHSTATIHPITMSGVAESGAQQTPASSHGGYSGVSEDSGDAPSTGLYVDGNGFRVSHPRHPALPRLRPEGSTLMSRWNVDRTVSSVFEFPAATNYTCSAITSHFHGLELLSSTYLELLQMFEILAGQDSLLYSAFGTSAFPSQDFIQECLILFVEGLSHDIPVVHLSTWKDAQVSWLLVLAAAAVGSLHHPMELNHPVASTFQELTRRAIRYTIEKLPLIENCVLRQACLLNACLAGQVWESSSLSIQDALTDLMLANQRSHQSAQTRGALLDVNDTSLHEWAVWIAHETRRRLDYFSWQTRFLTSVTTSVEGGDTMDSSTLPLPCSQHLWDLATADEFQKKLESFAQCSTIHDALQSLYLKRRIPQNCDGRGLIPLIYGVVHRTFEVSRQLLQPLKQWVPISQLRAYAENEPLPAQIKWLPANATYAAWRNSGCDCLDLLHWQTHVEIASATGLEGPQVTHLHLARLLLLTPFNEMISFARSSNLTGRPAKPHFTIHLSSTSSESPAKDAIMRWITLDDHKGRLSLIHAGAIFWHIRRYARGSFCEPFAILLSTLVLWLYGYYEPQFKATILANKAAVSRYQSTMGQYKQGQEPVNEEVPDANDTPVPITLDRPCDDEIVQIFIREGHLMDPRMFRAVRICSVEGSRRVLDEGIKLLARCQCSSYVKAGEYADVLVKLVAAIQAA